MAPPDFNKGWVKLEGEKVYPHRLALQDYLTFRREAARDYLAYNELIRRRPDLGASGIASANQPVWLGFLCRLRGEELLVDEIYIKINTTIARPRQPAS